MMRELDPLNIGVDPIRSLSRLALLLVGMVTVGCSGAEHRGDAAPLLPFTVRVTEVRFARNVEARSEDSHSPATSTPRFDRELDSLRDRFARALDAAGIFTRVIADPEPGVKPDLELSIVVGGHDFGPGTPQTGAAIYSTIAWLFTGHLSWFIENRSYSESTVALEVTIRSAASGEGSEPQALYADYLPVRGLRLNLLERADAAGWFLNIVLPPWWGDGDPTLAGRSLTEKAVDFFGVEEAGRIVSRLPSLHHERLGGSLIPDFEQDRIILVARRPLRGLSIHSERGETRSITLEEIGEDLVPDARRTEFVHDLSLRETGIDIGSYDRIYELGLRPTENGLIRIEATLDRETVGWTVFRPPSDSTRLTWQS